MSQHELTELVSEAEWEEAFPVMGQLRTHLDRESFLEYREPMIDEGYRLFALEVDDETVGCAGLTVVTNMYYGSHVWVYDLIVDSERRSHGYGLEPLDAVTQWAEERDCETVALQSGVDNVRAHRFYEERAGMERASHVFKRKLR